MNKLTDETETTYAYGSSAALSAVSKLELHAQPRCGYGLHADHQALCDEASARIGLRYLTSRGQLVFRY